MASPPSTAELVPELTQVEKDMYDELLDLCEEGLTEEEIQKRRTKIFVGGLKFSSDNDVLQDYFGKFGEIKEAVVIRERKSGLSKGYGFVTMKEFKSAVAAIQDKAPKLDGRRCNVCLAYIGQKKNALSTSTVNGYHAMTSSLISPYFVSGYGMGVSSPAVMGAGGQVMEYLYGSRPHHQVEPVLQIASRSPLDNRNNTLLQSSPTTLYHVHAPSLSHVMFRHQVLVAHPASSHDPPAYINVANQQHPSMGASSNTHQHQVYSLHDDTMVSRNSRNRHRHSNPIVTKASISPYTQVGLRDSPVDDVSFQSGHAIANGHVTSAKDTNHVIPFMVHGGHVIANHTNRNLASGSAHVMNAHVISHGNMATFVRSPTPPTLILNQRQIFQFQGHPAARFIFPSREILQQ